MIKLSLKHPRSQVLPARHLPDHLIMISRIIILLTTGLQATRKMTASAKAQHHVYRGTGSMHMKATLFITASSFNYLPVQQLKEIYCRR